jgi:hypothetical protein
MALKHPIPLPNGLTAPSPEYGVVFSIAWYLAELACGRSQMLPFLLPRQQLADVMGFAHNRTITRIVQWLERNGLIEEEAKRCGQCDLAKDKRCRAHQVRFGRGKGQAKKYLIVTSNKNL